MANRKEHWENVFATKVETDVSWFQIYPLMMENLQEKIINEVRDLLHKKQKLEREFFTPKEFSHITGLKYSTVVYHCKVGKLKARLINFQHPKNLPPKVENTLLNFPVSWQKKIM